MKTITQLSAALLLATTIAAQVTVTTTNTTCFQSMDGTIAIHTTYVNGWTVLLSDGTNSHAFDILQSDTTFTGFDAGNYSLHINAVGYISGDHASSSTTIDSVNTNPTSPYRDSAFVSITSPAPVSVGITSGATTTNTNIAVTFAPVGTFSSYSWNFGDGNTDINSSTSHAYSVSGTYTVNLTCTNATGCSGSAQVSISVVDPPPPMVGPNNATNGDPRSGSNYYPAARQNSLNCFGSNGVINVNRGTDESCTISITDLSGKLVATQQSNEWHTEMQVPAPGIYLVIVTNGNEVLTNKVMVK